MSVLNEISIRNFAIIESITIAFNKGLTVLSGETGAGKSIIIDAVHLLVGGRGSSEYVRHGEEKAEIEGLFILDDEQHPCYKRALEFGIDIDEGMLILRRDISKSGKSVCRINGKLVTISILREIGSTLIDIHGQHEHQELMNESLHLPLLDQFGGTKIAKSRQEYEEVYREYEQTMKRIKTLTENEQQMAHRLDLIQFQYEEITNADLKLLEDDALLEERNRLLNFEKMYEGVKISYNALQGEQKGLDWISLAMNHLQQSAEVDEELVELQEVVANSFYQLEDTVAILRSKLDFMEFDPVRLNEIEERLNEINMLKRKYGPSIEEILEYVAKIEEEIETLTNKETHIEHLLKQAKELQADLLVEGQELSELRRNAAERLTKMIHRELKALYMEKTVFEVHFTTDKESFHKKGIDTVEFYLSTNPGEPLKPLSKIASGGELSRIMLALKSIFSKHQGVTSIIFDEVDTGVSGRVAQAIAEKIHQVAIDSQVLCISHLPQVAAMADTHLFISKTLKAGRTKTTVKPLDDEEKIKEIGRMISGVEMTELTREHAKELLSLAKNVKIP